MTYAVDGKIREGWASIKEDGLKSLYWTKKYLILREISLDFHKNESSSAMSLSIPLKDIVSVNRTDLKPYCFEVIRTSSSQQGASQAPDAPRRTVFVSVKSDQDLYAWIDDVYSRCPSMGGVSNPTNFTHKVHVGFDPVSGGFTGLPEEWSKLLNSSAITKEDYQKNPQAVIEVLEFYTEGQQRLNQSNGFASMVPTPPTALAAQQRNLAMQMGSPAPSNGQRAQESRDREQWERERERDAYREKEFEKSQREQQTQRERQERERRQREQDREQEQKEREREERIREDELFNQANRQQEDYEDEDYPQKSSTSQQPIMMSGGGGGLSSQGRYNPMAPKPSTSAPRTPQKAANGRDMNPQRPAPSVPSSTLPRPAQGSQRIAASQQTTLRAPQTRPEQKSPSREPSPSANARGPTPISTKQPQLQAQTQASRIPAPATPTVKPLNVPAKPANAAKEVITKQERKETQKRISNMTEAQVMEKLRSVVSPGDPNQSYTKLKKVGQGASGSVYVAKINPSPASSMAASMLSSSGKNTARVAIKQMDLAHQPRKELIVNEILVMKESQHPNIVNFLDAFLKGNSELWVVMEYMEGGALTDVIENNNLEEDQIATICFEVSLFMLALIDFLYDAFEVFNILIERRKQTCKGLEHLHTQNIIHRDIKSDNVLLDAHGHVKISMF